MGQFSELHLFLDEMFQGNHGQDTCSTVLIADCSPDMCLAFKLQIVLYRFICCPSGILDNLLVELPTNQNVDCVC